MKKEITFIGLGRMGAAMVTLLSEKGYQVHGYDPSQTARTNATDAGIQVYQTLEDAVHTLDMPRTVWLMVPAKYVDDVIQQLLPILTKGDTIIDGGNSFFKDTLRRENELADSGINYIDCGTSGGVEGARNGASLMVGGEQNIVEEHAHLFKDLATENGYGHVGESGAGHFVKMVHNGIEYGMMGAIAEGLNVLHEHKAGLNLDIIKTLNPYQNGSIIESNLMNWVSEAYHQDGYLAKIAGEVPKGETEMEMEYLISNENVLILEAALAQRKATRKEPSFIGTLISAMRNQFGGHKIINKK